MFVGLRTSGWLLLLVLLSSGCLPIAEGPQDEAKNPYIVTGRERFKGRDYKGAIEAYEKALEVNPRSVIAHFELGVIYEQFENDYPAAIFHYNQVSKLRPDGSYPADNARQRIPGCKQEMLKTDSLATVNPTALRETERLREENVQLKQQIEFLQVRMANLQGQFDTASSELARRPASATPSPAPGTTFVPAPNPLRPAFPEVRSTSPGPSGSPGRVTPPPSPVTPARSTVVRPGDTFASIARRHGISVTALMRANPIVEPKRIKPGQSLNLPPNN
jgi:LysM repeat protein